MEYTELGKHSFLIHLFLIVGLWALYETAVRNLRNPRLDHVFARLIKLGLKPTSTVNGRLVTLRCTSGKKAVKSKGYEVEKILSVSYIGDNGFLVEIDTIDSRDREGHTAFSVRVYGLSEFERVFDKAFKTYKLLPPQH